MINWGNIPVGAVLPFWFGSYDGTTGASEAAADLAVGDILIYKGGSITQRSSTAGFTLIDTDGLSVDGVVGINGFTIDTGDDTDAGFYSVGDFFTVVVGPITIDTQTVNFVIGTFRMVVAEGVAGAPKTDVHAISADTAAADNLETAADGGAYNLGGGAVVAASVAGAVGSVTGNVGGVAAGGIDNASFAADAISASKVADDVGEQFADQHILRNVAGGSNSGRLVGEVYATIRNKVEVDPGTGAYTIYEEDDTTPLYTGVATLAARQPITVIDPA